MGFHDKGADRRRGGDIGVQPPPQSHHPPDCARGGRWLPVIVKPAATTPISCIEIVKLFWEAGLDERWCQTFITEDNALAESLAVDQRVGFLSFIGSAKVGWYLKSKLPPGTRCALEHGGAAPVIVDRSASIDAIVGTIVKGGYYHAGQVCVSVQRLFVHDDILANFTDALAAKVASLRVGDPTLKETEVGPLILPRETERVASWIKEATDAGARQFGEGGCPRPRFCPPSCSIRRRTPRCRGSRCSDR